MELQITIHSDDHELAIENARQLENDINFFVPEVSVKQLEKDLQPEDAAVNILDIAVKVLFGKDFLANITEVLKTWIEKRADIINNQRSRIQLEFKNEVGKSSTIILENVDDLPATIEALKAFANN